MGHTPLIDQLRRGLRRRREEYEAESGEGLLTAAEFLRSSV